MGEQKRRDDLAVALVKALIDQGKLIEGGFVSFAAAAIHKDAPQIQRDEMRVAYMAGAQHLLSSITSTLDPEGEPTDDDMRRLHLIHRELQAWDDMLALRVGGVAGSA